MHYLTQSHLSMQSGFFFSNLKMHGHKSELNAQCPSSMAPFCVLWDWSLPQHSQMPITSKVLSSTERLKREDQVDPSPSALPSDTYYRIWVYFIQRRKMPEENC